MVQILYILYSPSCQELDAWRLKLVARRLPLVPELVSCQKAGLAQQHKQTKGPATRPLLVSGLLSEAIRVQLIPGPSFGLVTFSTHALVVSLSEDVR